MMQLKHHLALWPKTKHWHQENFDIVFNQSRRRCDAKFVAGRMVFVQGRAAQKDA